MAILSVAAVILKNRRRMRNVSLFEALCAVVYDSEYDPSTAYPQVNLVKLVQALRTLERHPGISYKQLTDVLGSQPSHVTLRKYLHALVQLDLVSIESQQHRGIARTKYFFEVTQKGRALVLALRKISRM
jgi:predicted transcriptional regulator